ncbi:flavin reductase family protein [Microbacterium immunditiarum]|uniref:Flavin reductase (DIM6/NTAB) family NADH-FMN oxidoreductase RutF n=1 Tax=Microbacterium immunditiarum TaxID=337480 RepID=A0A7Y9GRS4_9MICO|nr:flavin reductase family protein [Microbacterium immunditiarum]NYE21529.1 flavin reductase (DIM6/NTAB) family NADH-FMN oxidoreductase RutF [Microbacterium immunditiarum]
MTRSTIAATGRSLRHDKQRGTAELLQRGFRDALGRYPTGVVLITAMTGDGPVGMACNSFTSVSLDPPMVAFYPMPSSRTWAALRPIGEFAVSILRADHEHVSRRFARKDVDKFADDDWTLTPAGHPVLADALGWLDARIETVAHAGDHDVVLASATSWSEASAGEPLVFFAGNYHSLATRAA